MPIRIIRDDITKIKCDAIVNPTDVHASHAGGTDAAIHATAGAELYRACIEQGGPSVGRAIITPAFSLPCRHVIHTVGPCWRGGDEGEEILLRACYRESLRLGMENKCKSIAFPLISAGTFGFPKEQVLRIAVDEIGKFLLENEMLVYIVVYDKSAYAISEKLFEDVIAYVDDHYVRVHTAQVRASRRMEVLMDTDEPPQRATCTRSKDRPILEEIDLDDRLNCLDESFSQMLLRKIDERGMTDAACYKRANIDRKLFSKIRGDVHYKPSKNTVLAFAIALELSLSETEEMLRKAGFALSHSNRFDVIIEYFISIGNYNIFEINEVLFQFDQNTLGG